MYAGKVLVWDEGYYKMTILRNHRKAQKGTEGWK